MPFVALLGHMSLPVALPKTDLLDSPESNRDPWLAYCIMARCTDWPQHDDSLVSARVRKSGLLQEQHPDTLLGVRPLGCGKVEFGQLPNLGGRKALDFGRCTCNTGWQGHGAEMTRNLKFIDQAQTHTNATY